MNVSSHITSLYHEVCLLSAKFQIVHHVPTEHTARNLIHKNARIGCPVPRRRYTSSHLSMKSATARKPLGLPPIPRTQALSSKTFSPPPLDGSLTIPELYDWHYKHSPEHPLFVYLDDHGNLVTITWKEAAQATHRTASLICNIVAGEPPVDTPHRVFAIVASNGMLPPISIIPVLTAPLDRLHQVLHPRCLDIPGWPCRVSHFAKKFSYGHRPSFSQDPSDVRLRRSRRRNTAARRGSHQGAI